MIRINLLAPERAKKPSSLSSQPAGSSGMLQLGLLLALFVGGALVLCAGGWWMQKNTIEKLDKQIAADEKRQRDLQAIKLQVDEFQRKKATLENKVQVIERLRLAQKSPVHMLDEVSKALPDYVWLLTMDETRGALKFKGESNSLAAVADFMNALQRSGWFPSVELTGAQDQKSLVTFDLSGQFTDPEVAKREAAAAAAAAAARPGPPPPAGTR